MTFLHIPMFIKLSHKTYWIKSIKNFDNTVLKALFDPKSAQVVTWVIIYNSCLTEKKKRL